MDTGHGRRAARATLKDLPHNTLTSAGYDLLSLLPVTNPSASDQISSEINVGLLLLEVVYPYSVKLWVGIPVKWVACST
ncbi:hypothetical protein CKO15_13510 [Halorhodospira abdelmalekii]|nr:hypothetical protein [Halorhodospira abdelmalekii]